MPDSLGSLYVELAANTAKFVGPLNDAARTAKSFANEVSRQFSSLEDVASQTFGAFGSLNPVISELSFAFARMGRSVSEAMGPFGKIRGLIGETLSISAGAGTALASVGIGALTLAVHSSEATAKLYELSQATGVSVEALSGLGYAAKQVGVSQETMATGLERMDRSADAAANAPVGAINAYTRLGVAVKDSAGNMRSTESIFEDLAKRFEAMADGPTKTALAIQLFGRSGAQLIPLLNQGSAAINDWVASARSMGLVITKEMAESAEHFQQTLGVLSGVAEGLANKLMVGLLPTLQLVADAVENDLGKGPDVSWIVQMSKQFVAACADMIEAARVLYADLKEFTDPLKNMHEQFAEDVKGNLLTAPFKDVGAVLTFLDSETAGDSKEAEDYYKKAVKDHDDFIAKLSAPAAGPMYGPPKPKQRSDAGGPDKEAEAAAKKFATALASVIAKLNEQAATAGMTASQIEVYRLKVLATTDAERAQLAAADLATLAWKAQQAKMKDGPVPPFRYVDSQSLAGLERLRDEYAGLSAAGTKWIANLDAQRDAAIAAVNAGAPPVGSISSINPSASAGPGPESSDSLWVKRAQQEGLRSQSRGGRQFGFSDDLSDLKEMQGALQRTGESTLLVDAAIQTETQHMAEQWDQASEKVGKLTLQYRALLDEIQRQGANPLGTAFSTIERSISSLSDVLAQLIVTGKNGFKQWADQLGEGLLKNAIQTGFGRLASLAQKGGTVGSGGSTSGGGGVLGGFEGTIAKAFGLKGAAGQPGKTPSGTASDPLYVVFSGAAGSSGNPLSQLGSFGSGTTPPFLPALSSPTSVLSSLGSLFGGDVSENAPSGANPGSFLGLPAPGGGSSGLGGLGSIFSKLGGGIGSAAGAIGGGIAKFVSMFGGFLAGGGDVTPGRTYMVGEKHPEFFTPKQAGTVSPMLRTSTGAGGAGGNTLHMHIHDVHDADSFRRSQPQIWAQAHAQLAMARSRNG